MWFYRARFVTRIIKWLAVLAIVPAIVGMVAATSYHGPAVHIPNYGIGGPIPGTHHSKTAQQSAGHGVPHVRPHLRRYRGAGGGQQNNSQQSGGE